MPELICTPATQRRRYRRHKTPLPGKRSGAWERWHSELVVDEGPDFRLFRWVHEYRCVRCGVWYRAEHLTSSVHGPVHTGGDGTRP